MPQEEKVLKLNDVWHTCNKIRAAVFRVGLDLWEYYKPLDPDRRCLISGINIEHWHRDERSLQALLKSDFIEYTKFAAIVEEAVATGCLEKAPLVVPLQHVPSEANSKTFLNFDERQKVAIAMDKLCQVRSPNLEEVFKDYDKENTGTVSKGHLIRTLSVRRMLELINNNELDAVHKCFSTERNGRLEFNYRNFLCTLYLLQENKKKTS
ncbi:PREDICTED: uncharacterized protein LOC105143124 [Acromyrmex echinatior]|uniref:uncharacterized protein LOC105143124 n=1 Tax=Acromyrmex echinatior TaxID=103372 RepID=UPI000580E2A2|nr:PREDICTED: uncharacterized protein LOC105143124 [Acromyrmex echinatior]